MESAFELQSTVQRKGSFAFFCCRTHGGMLKLFMGLSPSQHHKTEGDRKHVYLSILRV